MTEPDNPINNADVSIPEHVQQQYISFNLIDAMTMVGDYQPTACLRIAVPADTHFQHQQELQQLWRAPLKGGGFAEEWRPIPKEIV